MQPAITSSSKPLNRATKLIIFLALIILFSSVSFIAASTALSVTNAIYQGVAVADIEVGGLTEEEAREKLQAAFRARTVKPIELHYGERVWIISVEDIDIHVDVAKLAHEAYQIGRKGIIFEQIKERYLTVNRGYIVPMSISYSTKKLNDRLMNIRQDIDSTPENASLVTNELEFFIIPEKIGRKLNIAKTISDITSRINNTLSFTLNLTVDDSNPAIRATDLQEINSVIASYTTQFDATDTNRSENIYLAAKSVNSILIRQGDSFSFNHYVGPRLAQNGYKEAPVFIDGRLVPDWGGGVCQVSSTLYNAALLANMTIEERTSHFHPPGYVPIGQDATVADNLLDFKFLNSSSNNIYVKTETAGNQITISILGNRDGPLPEIQVFATDIKVLEPKIIVKQDITMELGKQVIEEEGQKGFLVTTHRIKKLNNKEIGRELLGIDEFKPTDKIVRVGTKALPAKGSK